MATPAPRAMRPSVYLDYAATSAVRPPAVADAIAAYLRECGGSPGRAGHARALEAGRLALHCRRAVAALIGAPGDPGRVTFQANATHALNVAIFGTVAAGDRIVRTQLDHNSVRRPVAALARFGVEEAVLPLGPDGVPDLDLLDRLLAGDGRPARLLVLPHASNVTGAVLPVKEMGSVARRRGALVVLDAAQTVGHYPVDVEALGVDLLAFSGHKGIAGPQGTGVLWVRDGVDVAPLLHGGTGGDSGPDRMPDALPDRLEAGTQNAPGIAGLTAALEWVAARGVAERHAEEMRLKRRLLGGLRGTDGVRIVSPDAPCETIGIVTLTVEGHDPGHLALALEREHGVQARAGLHCAPGAHEALGTLATGALRLSVGWATTDDDVDSAVDAIRTLRRSKRPT